MNKSWTGSIKEKILEFKERIFSDSLSKGIFIIASGTIIGQLITVVTMPILTRLYSPSDYGVLGLFSSSLTILGMAGGFSYEYALPLPKNDGDAANLFTVFLFILSFTSLFFLIIIFLFGNSVLSFFRIDVLEPYAVLLIFGFFGGSLYAGLTYWVTRRRDYTRITKTKIYQGFGGSFSKIILGIFAVGPIGLLIGAVLSQMMGIGTLVRYMWKKDRDLFKTISPSRMGEIAKQYIQFPLFACPAAIINTIGLQLPVFMIAAIYGLKTVGMYTMAYAVLVLTSSLISSSMTQVYYAEVSHLMRANSREIKKLFISTTKKLLFIGIPLIIIPSLLAPFFFPIIFGELWNEAGFFCLPLAIMALSNFVISPTSILGAYGYNHWVLIWDTSRTLLIFFCFYMVQVFSLPILTALFIFSCLMACMYGVNYLMNILAIDRYLEKDSGVVSG
jgi:O-antigen/teichoic acid export membrane protein